jgi:hypothetical protein
MQDIYNYIPETNHVSRLYSVASVLYLRFVLHVMLFRPHSYIALSVVCVQCPIRLFFVVPWFCAFLVCCSVNVEVVLKWFQSPLLLLELFLLSHSTCVEFLLRSLNILKFSQFRSWSHFCLQKLQHLLTGTFLFYYHGFWCRAYC